MADLSDFVAEIEALGAAPEEIAKEAAADALAALKAKTSAGRDISGATFAVKKNGGAYKDVSKDLSVAVSGSSFVLTLASPSNGAFFQNRMTGTDARRPRRQILPISNSDPEPREAMEAIERAIERVRNRKLGG